ncbi:putative B3 domain-containing protein LFL1 [Cocos nucifera]|uniref:V-type proton ATPase subunit C n=1 Tax=Cocos nucifera TaxID=13894 RepID=A0A8K0NB87_COCNU|nr:putative B3 domain-containing protein LFL1 [Cocos nucifera]
MVGTRLPRTAAARAAKPSDTEAEDARADVPDLRSAVGFPASRRRRTAARQRPEVVQNVAAPPSTEAETGRLPGPRLSMLDLNVPALDPDQAVDGLTFLLQKELSHSDASSLGRIVLPKREAEAYLPVLTARNGIAINMDDLETFQVWTFKYRYWPNNKSRMYILDNTANFINAHGLQIGDFIMIYKDDEKDRLVIRAKKAEKEQLAASADDEIFDSIVPDIVVASIIDGGDIEDSVSYHLASGEVKVTSYYGPQHQHQHQHSAPPAVVDEFNTPDLRVGTLDSLLALSDDLAKSNAFIEGVSHKIRRQIEDLERASGVEGGALTVDGVPVDSYLTRFVWDEAKYPTMSPLREIVDSIHVQVAKIEDDMKVRAAEYNNIRGQLNIINRKQSGSLAVRDLSNLVKPEDIITSEHLVTLLAVVSKYSQKDWLSSYETLTTYVVKFSDFYVFIFNVNCGWKEENRMKERKDRENEIKKGKKEEEKKRKKGRELEEKEMNEGEEKGSKKGKKLKVKERRRKNGTIKWGYEIGNEVPRSTKKLHEDNEYALYTVTLFGRVADNFKTSARERGFQIREFEYSPEAQESRKQELEKLLQDLDNIRSSLLQWCYASYGEVFSSWMHFCAVRVFAESILRYGLPPSFLAAVLAPSAKGEKKVRSILEELSGNVNSTFWKSEDEVGFAGLGGEAEAYPYVSFTINIV